MHVLRPLLPRHPGQVATLIRPFEPRLDVGDRPGLRIATTCGVYRIVRNAAVSAGLAGTAVGALRGVALAAVSRH